MNRYYRILVARDRAGIFALAGREWNVLENTIKPFNHLDIDDDHSLPGIDGIKVHKAGFVALAWR